MALLSHISLRKHLQILFLAISIRFKKSDLAGFAGRMSKKVSLLLTPIRFFFVFCFIGLPLLAQASLFTTIFKAVFGSGESSSASVLNSQNIPILQAPRSFDDTYAQQGGGNITITGGTALMPAGTMVEITEGNKNGEISTYIVRSGDTLSSIAKMYGVSVNTIVWANDIKGSKIKEGQKLVILPISGIRYMVQKGDTLSGLAKKYGADIFEITTYNNLQSDSILAIGDEVIIPGGKIPEISTPASSSSIARGTSGVPSYEGYYIRPINGGYKSQGLHGYNAVDLATYLGAPIFASAEGRVTVSRDGGWNGGYGSYVVINHPNGTQTLYSHLHTVSTQVGAWVSQGEVIGSVGSTGRSTGPHLHFEIRGARNPF